MKTIGLIGAGHIGSQIARLSVAHGFDVVVSNSRGPETLAALVKELGSKARAATAIEAAQAGDIVVVTIPLRHYKSVPVAQLAGKIVVDTNNYYPQRDGHIAELDNESTTTAELLQAHLPTSKVVKAFNHIYAAELTTHGQPAGTPNRRARSSLPATTPKPKQSSLAFSTNLASTRWTPAPSKRGGASNAIRPVTDRVEMLKTCDAIWPRPNATGTCND